MMLATIAALAMSQGTFDLDVQLAWIEVPPIKYPLWTELDSKLFLRETVDATLLSEMKKAGLKGGSFFVFGADVLNGSLNLSQPKSRTFSKMSELAKKAPAKILVVVDIDAVYQKNLSATQSLSNIAGPQSETRANVSGAIFDARIESLRFWEEKSAFIGRFEGPYFGTTNKNEMAGDPSLKDAVIRMENRKRLDAIAKATWQAIKDPIFEALGKR